ncbi:MAG: PKD domain-containing protein [Chitinophagaceae bacterium]|nr:PKD domain-containing protein [Chitinophagaceae bacterium]
MKIFLLYILFCTCCLYVFAQTDTAVVITQKENKVSFKAQLSPLTQIPGAPKPFYTYLWDFGDGHFSTQENPEHIYDKAGDFEAMLYAVNNYDDGKKPGRKRAKVRIKGVNKSYLVSNSQAEQNFFKANGVFELKYNCMAKPGDTMVLMAGWKTDMAVNGKVYLFINEKQFGQNSFDTAGFSWYHDAVLNTDKNAVAAVRPFSNLLLTSSGSPPSNIKDEKKFTGAESKTFLANTLRLYNNVFAVDVKNNPADAQFMFANLFVTPGMIKDTNATITITGLFVPDSGNVYMHQLNIPIVTSHDPNKMNLKQGRLNYRLLKKSKSLDYKIRFQNDGEGPARKIKLGITLPSAMDPQTIQIKDMSPYCLPCDSVASRTGCWELLANKDSAAFIFNGIYLPGTNQKGVDDKDSTKGFVEFDVKTKKKLDNLPFKGRTAIYFDKNEPVITNFATGRFKPALSPIVMAGYELQLGSGLSDGLNAGVGIAKLAPYKPYLQFEFFGKAFRSTSSSGAIAVPGSVTIDGRIYDYKSYTQSVRTTVTRAGLVPLHLRYNFNDLLSAGIGVRVDADIAGRRDTSRNYILNNFNGVPNTPYIRTRSSSVSFLDNAAFLPFADVQFGRVRLGPQIGTRFYYGGNNRTYLYFYVSWRL